MPLGMQGKKDRMGKTSKRGTPKGPGLLGALLLIAAAGLVMSMSRYVKADDLPPSRQVVILMRVLAYDGNLKSRAGDTINIAVMHKKGNSSSEQMANAMVQAFIGRQSTLVNGLPIAVAHVAYDDPSGLKKSIAGSALDFLYVCDGLEGDLDNIKDVTRQTRVLSVGARQEYVEKGLSLGAFQNDGKSTILINLQASRLEGVSFSSDLLGLANVIR
jgi:hypothetical protein